MDLTPEKIAEIEAACKKATKGPWEIEDNFPERIVTRNEDRGGEIRQFIHDWTTLGLRSYDQILCAGNGNMSRLIQRYNRVMGVTGIAATISHVAEFYHGALWTMGKRHDMCFESTLGNYKWNGKKGVQVNAFQDFLDHYDGKVYTGKLDFIRTERQMWLLDKFVLDNIGKPYESGIPGLVELLLTDIDLPWFSEWRKRTIAIHCGEKNVLSLQNGRILLNCVRPNKMPPYKFWNGGEFEQHLSPGIRMERIMRIK